MDDDESKVKKRVLPSWMTEDNSGTKKLRPAELRRKKTQVVPRKRTVYCMNEKEVVECALEILTRNKVQRDEEEKPKVKIQEDKEDSEKRPPISPASEVLIPPLPDVSEDPEEDSDNDPLKYVREIFFS